MINEMKKANILICDDNASVLLGLTGYIEAEGMSVCTAETGEAALEIMSEQKIDLAILDIMLPGMSGIEVCHEIKDKYDIPVLLLSAKGEEIDRIIGLEMGADDYVTKPFSSREVVIRTKKLLSRSSLRETVIEKNCIRAGNLRIYPESFEAFSGSHAINFTPREFKLLCYLADNAGRIRSRDQIISEIWGTDFEGETRVVDILINRLRAKLQEAGEKETGVTISTVFGVGYKLEEVNEA